MKIFRNIVIGTVSLVVILLIAATVFFTLIFDPNDYRDNIATLVKEHTGRDLRIDGELDVKLFPWLGFDVGRTSLGEDPRFGDQDFVSLDGASVRIKLLPLLFGQLEIGQITVSGLTANLIRDERGVDNWRSLADSLATDAGDEDAAAEEGGGQITSKGIGGVAINDASLTFDDRQARSKTTLTGIDLHTGSIMPGQPVEIESGFDISSSEGQLEARVGVTGQVRNEGEQFIVADPILTVEGSNDPQKGRVPFGRFSLKLVAQTLKSDGENHQMQSPALTLSGSEGVDGLSAALEFTAGTLTGAGQNLRLEAPVVDARIEAEGLATDVPVRFRARQLSVALDKQTMELSDYALEALDVAVTGSLSGTKILDDPDLRGSLQIAAFSPRALLARLELPVDTADGTVLTSFSGKLGLRIRPNAVRFTKMDLALDDTRVRGLFALTNLKNGAKSFDLEIDQIDIDRYLAPGAAPAEGSGSAADALEIPAQTLRDLRIKGTLKIGQLKFSGLESRDVLVGIDAKNGKLRVHPSQARLYGGSYSGDIRVNASGEVPVVSINERVNDIDFGAFAGTVVENNPLSGRVTGQVRLEGRGHDTAQIRQTLNGTTSFNFKDGVIEGIDIMEILDGIVALANGSSPARGSGPKRTKFSRLAGDATITDGVLSTDNLVVAAAALNIGGSGLVDLNTRALDFKVEARIVESEGIELDPDLKKAVGYKIPVFIGGTYDAPQWVGKDRSVASLVKQWGVGRLIDKLGLFGKDEDPQEAADGEDAPADEEGEPRDPKEELEDKAKGLLKDLLGGG